MALVRQTKQPSESRLFDFDFSGKMRTSATIASVVSVVAAPSGLTIGSTAFSGQIAQARLSAGTDQTEYLVTCTVTTSDGDTLELDGLLWVEDLSTAVGPVLVATVGGTTSNSYVTLGEANTYFAGRLGGEAWADVENGTLALITATAEIDKLNFYGMKTNSAQALKFPRLNILDDEGWVYDSNVIPVPVKQATCEMALYLSQAPEVLESGGDLGEFKSLELGNSEIVIEPSGPGASKALPGRISSLLSSLRAATQVVRS